MGALRKETLVKLAFVLGGCLAAFLLMEVGIRLIDPPPRPLHRLNLGGYVLSENPVLGYEFKPGYRPSDPPFDPSHRNFAINSQGFRDYDFPVEKGKGTLRIIVLGDSLTVGNGVEDLEATYPKLLQGMLNRESSGTTWEVLNMGVGGYHTLQEVETLRVKGLQYKPDIVIIGFSITDFYLDHDGYVYSDLLYNLEREELDALGRIYRLSGRTFHEVLGRSRLIYFLYHRWRSLVSPPPEPFRYKQEVLEGSDPVEVGLALLDRLQQEHVFRSYLFIIPGDFASLHEYRYGILHEKALSLAARYPFLRAVDLTGAFQALGRDGMEFSFDGSHLNESGHVAVAEMMFRALREDLGSETVSGPGR